MATNNRLKAANQSRTQPKLGRRLPSPGASRHPLPFDGRGASPQSGEGVIPAGEVYLTKEAVAKRLGVKPKTVSDWANGGKLPAYRVGRYLRFKWAEIEHSLRRVTDSKPETGNLRAEWPQKGA